MTEDASTATADRMIKTYRAKSIQEALRLVRDELGPDAEVLHTRRVNAGLLRRVVEGSQIEVAATVRQPSQSASLSPEPDVAVAEAELEDFEHRERYRRQLQNSSPGVDLCITMPVDEPKCEEGHSSTAEQPTALFDALTSLLESDIDTTTARHLLARIRDRASEEELSDSQALATLIRSMLQPENLEASRESEDL